MSRFLACTALIPGRAPGLAENSRAPLKPLTAAIAIRSNGKVSVFEEAAESHS